MVLGLSCNATGVEVNVSDELQFIARASIIDGGPPRARADGTDGETARGGAAWPPTDLSAPLSGPSIDPRLQSTKVVI